MTQLILADSDQFAVHYNPFCKGCKMWQGADEVCEPSFGRNDADIMVVSRMPNSERYQTIIETALLDAGVELSRVFFTSVLKCRNWELEARKREIKACTELYLQPEIDAVKPKYILLFGNEALNAVTGHSGINNYRGKVIEKHGAKIIPTISPAAVQRSPMLKPAWDADILFFVSQVNEVTSRIPKPKAAYIDTKAKLVKLKKRLMQAQILSYDIETAGELGTPEGGIVSIAGTYDMGDGQLHCFFIPLDHPESVWRKIWIKVIQFFIPVFERVPRQVAHNGKFDAKWLRSCGVPARVTFDTMLAAHLLDENRLKGLKPLCRMLLGVPAWGIDTKDLRNTPLKDIFKYNVLDTWNMHHLYLVLKKDMIAQPRLHRIFRLLTMPANEELIGVELKGIWIDRQLLNERTKIAFDMRDDLDRELMTWVPNPDDPMEDERVLTWPKMGKRQKWAEVNFNASNWMRWFMFEWLRFPVIERGKTKEDDSPGDPSLAEATMVELKELYPDHPVLKLLTERSKWQKYCSTYVSRYSEIADDDDRIHTTFKLAGTVTGRLSSGKEDEEKITAKRDRGRGVNLQQVPRDSFIRGLFGAAPGYSFVEADFGQIEFRLAVFISRDKNGLWLIRNGIDVHLAMAAKMTGKPESQVTKEERKAAKPVNFGYLYGMGWKKFMETAKLQYGIFFTEAEAQASRKAFFDMYPGFLQWHERQRRLVSQYGRVQSPIGRVRHLPDINSADKMVRMEAERQAINSPVQAMASDMNALAMVILAEEFRQRKLRVNILGLVHDAINFEIHNDDLAKALPLIKRTMENLPLKKKFGCEIDIPIVADIKVGSHWGGAKELTDAQIYDFNAYYEDFVEERAA